MEVSNKNVKLLVGVSKKVPDLAVCIQIAFPGIADCCLKRLLNNTPHDNLHLMKGSEQACLAFALYQTIRDKLLGSVLEMSKSHVSNVKCKALNGHLLIYWNCQGNGSSLRKSLGLAISCLAPNKLYTKYNNNVKFLSGKGANKEGFNYCANQMIAGIKKGVLAVAVGRINTDKDKLSDILSVVSKKFPDVELASAKETEQPKHDAGKVEEYPILKCSGISCIVAADYISKNAAGMGVDVIDEGVQIYNKGWDAKHKQLKDAHRIADYVRQKYEKLGDELPCLLAYFAISQDSADADTLAKIIKSKPKSNDLRDLIKKVL